MRTGIISLCFTPCATCVFPLTEEISGIPRRGPRPSYFHQENVRKRRWCMGSPELQRLCRKHSIPGLPELVRPWMWLRQMHTICATSLQQLQHVQLQHTAHTHLAQTCPVCNVLTLLGCHTNESKLLFVQAVGYTTNSATNGWISLLH